MPANPVTPTALQEDLAGYLEFLTEVAETRVDPLKLTEEYEDLPRYYRALGICQLSGEADIDGFFHHLIQSALTRRHYLQAVQPVGGGDPRFRRASFLDPAFDAIAARQWRLAGELFQLVAHAWTEGEEYEDDFCYAEVVRRLATEPDPALEPVLARWGKVLEGGADLRLEVARALVARDQPAFCEALGTLLAAEDAKAVEMSDPVDGCVLADDLPFFPNHWVSIEGLALLALAERRGVEVQELFKGCPPSARAGVFGPFWSRGYPHAKHKNE